MRLFVFFLLLLGPAAHGSERQAEPLTVMTFNIRYGTADDGVNQWSARKDHLFELIQRELVNGCLILNLRKVNR